MLAVDGYRLAHRSEIRTPLSHHFRQRARSPCEGVVTRVPDAAVGMLADEHETTDVVCVQNLVEVGLGERRVEVLVEHEVTGSRLQLERARSNAVAIGSMIALAAVLVSTPSTKSLSMSTTTSAVRIATTSSTGS